ncbi:MAG: polysaccharide deacetylase family protein [Geminicoccaceae bacterium]|nr:polysaccharide deacetylase family protein [Geminicoccaceae bacterium]
MSWRAQELFGTTIPVHWPGPERPRVHVILDTEESFDWRGPFRREGFDLAALRALPGFVRRLERFGIVPTCVVTYPVVDSAEGSAILRELAADGRIEVGAHLHPWVNPPHLEPLGPRTSFAGNLAPELEAAKLAALSARIGETLGVCAEVYKAGRYGLGPATAATLVRLGYRVDTSGYPHRDFSSEGGPDFRAMPERPFRFGPGARLLELPMSCGLLGPLARSSALAASLESARGRRPGLAGAFARMRLLRRVTLTPEGFELPDLLRLARALVARGHRVLCLSLHSPSLAPGNTPYAPDARACAALVAKVEAILECLLGELAGTPSTARGLLRELEAAEGAGS